MAAKDALDKLKDAARDTIKNAMNDPIGTASKAAGQAMEQARGAVAVGRTVAGRATRSASGVVASRLPDRRTGGPAGATSPTDTPRPVAVPAEAPRKTQGDPVEPATPATTKAPATKAPAKKAAAKKTPAKKTPAKKTPAKKTATKKTATKATPADVAKKAATKAPAERSAGAKKAPGEQGTPSGRLPAKKAAKKTATKTAKKTPPLSAEELAAGAGTETITPTGTRGADVATNPDTTETDLQQPGTEPLMDPSTTKQVASESETLGRASDPEKG